MKAVHYIGAGNLDGWAATSCGIEGRSLPEPGQYERWGANPITAVYRSWDGVTCKRCLRNRHAPGRPLGRLEARP